MLRNQQLYKYKYIVVMKHCHGIGWKLAALAALASLWTFVEIRQLDRVLLTSTTASVGSKSSTGSVDRGEEPPTVTPPPITIDTAIIISSSWIPTHPSTAMLDSVIDSVDRHLIGLPDTVPIFIPVDHMAPVSKALSIEERDRRIPLLDQYVLRAFAKYLLDPRIHIVPSMEHWHVGGIVNKTLSLIEIHYPTVRYLYYLQHDLSFKTDVNHTALIETMQRHTDVNYIRFERKVRWGQRLDWCNATAKLQYNVLSTSLAGNTTDGNTSNTTTASAVDTAAQVPNALIWQSNKYSDNNHLVRFDWYTTVIRSLGFLKRFPDGPLQVRAKRDCHGLGLFTYGMPGPQQLQTIDHLDGRKSTDFLATSKPDGD